MEPTSLDVEFVQLLAPLQRNLWLADVIDTASKSSLTTGLVFAVPVFLCWRLAQNGQRRVITILLAIIVGSFGSIAAQQMVRWRPPATNPATTSVYAPRFHDNANANSFPSDSTMLYGAVAFGIMAWNSLAGAGLLAWLLIFVAPVRIFTGGHYPTDIAAGLLLGFLGYQAARYITRNNKYIDALARNASPVVAAVLFAAIFEIGKGFADVREVANLIWHLRRHL